MVTEVTGDARVRLDQSLQVAIDGIGDARAVLTLFATGNEHERRLQQMAVRALEAAEKAVYTLHRRAIGIPPVSPRDQAVSEEDRIRPEHYTAPPAPPENRLVREGEYPSSRTKTVRRAGRLREAVTR